MSKGSSKAIAQPLPQPVTGEVEFLCQQCRLCPIRIRPDEPIPDGEEGKAQAEQFLLKVYQLIEYTSEMTSFCAPLGDSKTWDQPACRNCTAANLARLERECEMVEKEAQEYAKAIEGLDEEEEGTEAEMAAEIEELERQQVALQEELDGIYAQTKELRKGAAEEELPKALEESKEAFSQQCNDQCVADLFCREESATLDQQIEYEKLEIKRFNGCSILNEAFHIWSDGHFGTINNFRLGRLTSQPVEWSEINAAWGQAALLLHTIMRVRGFKPQKFRINPSGSFSTVLTHDSTVKSEYELYGGAQVFFANSRFDKAMVGFLSCLEAVVEKELNKYKQIPTADPTMAVPFPIVLSRSDGTVGGYSVKLSKDGDEKWTKSMKLMLTIIKWLISIIHIQDLHEQQAKQRDLTL